MKACNDFESCLLKEFQEYLQEGRGVVNRRYGLLSLEELQMTKRQLETLYRQTDIVEAGVVHKLLMSFICSLLVVIETDIGLKVKEQKKQKKDKENAQ